MATGRHINPKKYLGGKNKGKPESSDLKKKTQNQKQQQQNHKRKNTACVIQCSFMENRSTSNKPDLVSKF